MLGKEVSKDVEEITLSLLFGSGLDGLDRCCAGR